MKSEQYHIAGLIAKSLRGHLSAEEQRALQAWIDADQQNRELFDSLQDSGQLQQELDFIAGIDVDHAWHRIVGVRRHAGLKRVIRYLGYAAAVVLVACGVWWFTRQDIGPAEPQVSGTGNIFYNDVMPGSSKATLILSDGRQVDLVPGIGELKEQDGTTIERGADGLSYRDIVRDDSPLIYNTVVVPKTGTYQLTLADGTRVWLNAMSELRFPVHFGTTERAVYLKGEAYFEVQHHRDWPFRVDVEGTQVEVLGTHFNINAYDGVRATLAEGGIRIVHQSVQRILTPGEEAVVDNGITVQAANLSKALAWKEGEFYFKSDGIEEIMGQLSRWYDLTIDFKGPVPDERFNGTISRSAGLMEVLEMLSFLTGAHFELRDRHVTVRFPLDRQQMLTHKTISE